MNKLVLVHHDQIYIDALRNGDSPLIEKFYAENARAIIEMVKKNGGTAADAADLFQDVILLLYRQALNGFELSCPLSAFLYQVCKRRWLNRLRDDKMKYVVTDSVEELSIDLAEQVSDLEKHELQEQLFLEKFSQLGPACKELLSMSWQEKEASQKRFTLIEIAEKTDRSYDYVRKKIAECRERLMSLVTADPKFKDLN